MNAIQLESTEGLDSLRLVEIEKPRPGNGELLIQVKAAGINFAELEMTRGKYPPPRPLPTVLGFEASGIVTEIGANVTAFKPGDKVVSLLTSGGFAEYATANASMALPIPDGISFPEATAITVQGLSAYTLLKFAARPQPEEIVLIQSAAGGVGLLLVQLAKIFGVKKVIALASSKPKLDFVTSLGADVAVDYSQSDWPSRVLDATGGKGVDVVLECVSGDIGDQSFKLIASFGRMIMYGARNAHDHLPTEKVRQLIHKNQSVIGFNFPSLLPEQIRSAVSPLLDIISKGKVKLFVNELFPLRDVRRAFEEISARRTMGKVVLIP